MVEIIEVLCELEIKSVAKHDNTKGKGSCSLKLFIELQSPENNNTTVNYSQELEDIRNASVSRMSLESLLHVRGRAGSYRMCNEAETYFP